MDNPEAATANQAAALCAQLQKQYATAEPYFRYYLGYLMKHLPGQKDRFFAELHLGVSLLAQRKYADAKSHFLIGYNGLGPGANNGAPLENADLGRLIEQVEQLRDENGVPLCKKTLLSVLHRDPTLEAIVFDVQFPAEPFAPL